MIAERTAVRGAGPVAAPGRARLELPRLSAILAWPLPDLGLVDRVLVRGAAMVSRARVGAIRGLEHIAPERDPFILAINHSTRQEALLVPPLLILLRSGRRIHFLADWNFRMIPGVDLLYRRAGANPLTKPHAYCRRTG